MISSHFPRLMLAAPSSGSGKTTVTCALLQAFCQRGIKPASFKCGPDYIDPMFHQKVIGVPSRNLDPFFCSENTLRFLLARGAEQARLSLLEGVMGYYDGLGGRTSTASSYHLAKAARTPVVLVVDGKGMSFSAAALVQGFLRFRPDSGIQGVLLNRVSPMAYPLLRDSIESQCGVKVYGFLPVMEDCSLKSRHLGLVTAREVEDLQQKLTVLAQQAEQTVDLDGLLKLADSAPPLEWEPLEFTPEGRRITVAYAKDSAFCFYYEDNFKLLQQLGIDFIPFSPLYDGHLPEGISGLWLGGGYPELYAQQLYENHTIREEIFRAVDGGMPCIAECGGFLYLQQSLDGVPMAGALPGEGFETSRLQRFGYVELTARRDNLLCSAGETIRAHEFHYWDSSCCGDSFIARKPSGERSWNCVQTTKRLYAGFPHLYLYANPSFAQRFAQCCRDYDRERNGFK